MLHLGSEILRGVFLFTAQGCCKGLVESLLIAPEEVLPVGPGGRSAGSDPHGLKIGHLPSEKIAEYVMQVVLDRLIGLTQPL